MPKSNTNTNIFRLEALEKSKNEFEEKYKNAMKEVDRISQFSCTSYH